MMTTEKRQLIVAALLHDIGKLYQRADDRLNGDSAIKDLSEAVLRSLVPYGDDGQPMYQHAIWTYQFLEENVDVFKKIGLWETSAGKLSELAARHHQPITKAEQFVQLANDWSSTADRHAKHRTEAELSSEHELSSSTRLKAPFTKLNINGKQGSKANVPIAPLSTTAETIFPEAYQDNSEEGPSLRSEYQQLWRAFLKDFNRIPTENADDFLFTLQQTIRKHLWCIASDVQNDPIVNLYEHLKTTAAFTSCLESYSQETGLQADELRNTIVHYPIRMVCLDLSGIQSFIYDISSRKAFKSLKGRSYFLTALVDQIVDTILQQTNQSYVNLLYAAGGKAFLLLPNTTEIDAGLTRAQILLEDQIWHEEGGGVFPAIGSAIFTLQGPKVFSPQLPEGSGDLGMLWKLVSDLANQAKNRRYERILKNNFDEVFSENASSSLLAGSTDNLCAVSGQPIAKGKGKLLNPKEKDGPVVTERVHDHIKVGRLLKDAKYIISGKEGSADLEFKLLNSKLKFSKDIDVRGGQRRICLNGSDFLPVAAESGAYGFTFYGGNTQPEAYITGGEVAEFEDLCFAGTDKYDKNVIEKLGVLRMDVDGLGQLFINGFAESDKTFAAYATLSAQLDLFFSGYLNTIREEEEYKGTISVVYSGGDDIFALGRWDRALAFAERIREDFRRFTDRDDLTISGGLTIVDHKFPIYRAAALAGVDEQIAKRHLFKGQVKNAITLFSVALNWDKEFPIVKQLQADMVHHVENGLSRSFLHTIREAYASSLPDIKTGKRDLSYKWQTAYTLKRMTDRYRKRTPEIAAFVNDINNNLLHNDDFGADHYLKLAAVASRWAERTLKLPGNE